MATSVLGRLFQSIATLTVAKIFPTSRFVQSVCYRLYSFSLVSRSFRSKVLLSLSDCNFRSVFYTFLSWYRVCGGTSEMVEKFFSEQAKLE